MKARLPKGYGRPDPNAMMRQVQKMQDEIRAKQEELEAKEYTGTASGEMVTVTMTGKHEITAGTRLAMLLPLWTRCWKRSSAPKASICWPAKPPARAWC